MDTKEFGIKAAHYIIAVSYTHLDVYKRQGHRSDRIPSPEEPSESPRHFAASMDESVIVGYYTLKKCLSVALRCLQIPKKGEKIHGKK